MHDKLLSLCAVYSNRVDQMAPEYVGEIYVFVFVVFPHVLCITMKIGGR